MSSNAVSWKEVIRRRYMKEDEMKLSTDESANTDTVAEERYSAAEGEYIESISEEYNENEFGSHKLSDTNPYQGMDHTIVCQVIPGQGKFH